MYIETILDRIRRDIKIIIKCEHCDYSFETWGYDDTHYHNVVVPNMECPQCKAKASGIYKPRTPRYPDEVII